MKVICGVLMILAGVALGLYVGLWVCFIGGIVDIINEIKAERAVEGLTIAWGIVKIIFAWVAGALAAMVLILPGIAVANSD